MEILQPELGIQQIIITIHLLPRLRDPSVFSEGGDFSLFVSLFLPDIRKKTNKACGIKLFGEETHFLAGGGGYFHFFFFHICRPELVLLAKNANRFITVLAPHHRTGPPIFSKSQEYCHGHDPEFDSESWLCARPLTPFRS